MSHATSVPKSHKPSHKREPTARQLRQLRAFRVLLLGWLAIFVGYAPLMGLALHTGNLLLSACVSVLAAGLLVATRRAAGI